MLFRNTLAQSSRLVVGQVLSVILAPILIAKLGLTAFGIWAVTGAAASYVSLLDFGVTRSLSRFVAMADARDDRTQINRIVAVGFMAVTILGTLAILIALFAAPLVDKAIDNPIGSGPMRTVLLSSAVLLTFQLYGQVCDTLASGQRRYVPPNVAGIVAIALNFGASVAILFIDPTLTSYALANAASAIPGTLAALAAMLYVGGWPVVAWPSWRLVREIVSFGVKTQVSMLATLINFQTDKLVIAVGVGVRAAASYEIGARVALAVRELSTITVSAMIPQATVEIARHGRQVIGTFYRQWSTRVIGISVGVFALAGLCSPYLLTAWIGHTPAITQGVLVALCAAYLAWSTTGVASTIAIGAGEPGIVARNAAGVAVLNVALTVALAPAFGTWGVLSGTIAAMTIMAVAFLVRFHRVFDLPARAFLDAAIGPFTLGTALLVPLALLVAFVLPDPSGRAGAFGLLVAVGGTFGLAYWYGATTLDYLPTRLRLPGVRPRAPVGATAPPS